jgi:hypothetical protein
MSKRSKGKHSSVRGLEDASTDLPPSPFDDPPEIAEDNEVDDDENEDAPRVVLGTIADLGKGIATYPDRPIWVLLEADESMVGVFERYPEAPMPPADAASLLAAIRQFASDNALNLQTLLGPTDQLRVGFHTSASMEEVVESFEDDGFDVLLGIVQGRVELPGDQPG